MPQRGKRHADEQLLLALACGATVETAAQKAGPSPATAYRRLQEPAFQQQLQQLRADMLQRTGGTLTAAGSEAVKTLLALLKDAIPPSTRLGAARAILEMGMRSARRPNSSSGWLPWKRASSRRRSPAGPTGARWRGRASRRYAGSPGVTAGRGPCPVARVCAAVCGGLGDLCVRGLRLARCTGLADPSCRWRLARSHAEIRHGTTPPGIDGRLNVARDRPELTPEVSSGFTRSRR
jgi:hypothetical protein